MAIVTQSRASQSSSALNGQSTTYIKGLVQMMVSGAPDSLVNSVINLTLQDFYLKSMGWRARVGPYSVPANLADVQLNPVNAYAQLMIVLDAWLVTGTNNDGTQRLRVSARPFLGTDTGTPTSYFMTEPDVMTLFPKPDANLGQKLYVWAVLKPTVNTTQLPAIATEQHLDGLVAGCLARLFAIPNRPYTNAQGARDNKRTYMKELLIARDMANRGNGAADTPWQFPPFDGGGSQLSERGF